MSSRIYCAISETEVTKALADLRTDGAKRVRIARKLSEVEPQVQKRNFPSVEQIQDSECEAIQPIVS